MITVMAALALAQGTVGTLPPIPVGWRWYTNVRFGFAVCYPPELRPGPESENGDGRSFASRDGVEMTASGINNEDGASIDEEERDGEAELHPEVYRRRKANWLVYTGRKGSRVVWNKTVTGFDRFATVNISYPAAVARHYDPIVAQLSKCFRVGKPAF